MSIQKFKLSDFIHFVSTAEGILRFEGKGFISKEAAEDIREEYLTTWKAKVDSFRGESFVALADLRGSAVPSDEAKAFIIQGMSYAINHGMIGSIEVVPGALVKMTTKRMMQYAEEGKKMDFRYQVASMEEALAKAQELLVHSL